MDTISKRISSIINEIKNDGLYKDERIISSQQNSEILVENNKVLNFCANNYLGLSNNQELINYAKIALDKFGFGLSSVRFICGTQNIHKDLENKISIFLEKEDTILYTSCFDANGGLYETILDENDVIISDELNHASIIDGVRLSKAKRFRYKNSNMSDLEDKLKQCKNFKNRLITTDGVFSMDGYIAKLDEICKLAKKYDALVHVDDSHATGFLGEKGKGSIEYCNVIDRVDIVTSTLGKALGGASGGFTSSSKEIIDLLRQKSRPYLFSNTIPPVITYTAIKTIDMLTESDKLRKKLMKNTSYFRKKIQSIGYTIKNGVHPIVPIMLGDAKLAQKISKEMLKMNVFVIGFSYPVVPKNEARIRVQISSSHSKEQLDYTLNAFDEVAKKLNLFI
ncbi:MAG: glycine C-acetyltransferase [Candidatus Marinimicrobia bacterium]|nr:glycine C-acetyltransferase [Candidatus Neomarinimicrobiota bacterium]